MKKILAVLALGALATGVSSVKTTTAASKVNPAKADCIHTTAVLMESSTGNHQYFWDKISGVINQQKYSYWKKVDQYEPGISQQFSFAQYSNSGDSNVTAYAAHCGHGATCNALAQAVVEAYPEVGDIDVYCTNPVPPPVLDNPQSPGI